MSKQEHVTLAQVQRRYPGLEIVDKGPKLRFQWLRFQAHRVLTEQLDLPAIPKVRAAVSGPVTIRELMGHGSTLEDLANSLARAA
jgi:hypothetical protein